MSTDIEIENYGLPKWVGFLRSLIEKPSLGDCFHAAFLFAGDHPYLYDVHIVHGKPLGQGPIAGERFDHAWVEIGDVVIDPSNEQLLITRRDTYYMTGDIDASLVKRYDLKEAIERAEETGHSGPWE